MNTETKEAPKTIKELELELKARKEESRKARKAAKEEYESKRDSAVNAMIFAAISQSERVKEFKKSIHAMFDEQAELRKQYAGGLSKNSKGGFTLATKDGKMKVTRRLSSIPNWDERAEEAVNLINDFLESKLKRTKAYNAIRALIEKNKAGDLSYSMVMRLQSIRDDYDDPRWVKGMELLEESYERVYSGYGYDFRVQDEHGRWEKIEINFHSL